MTRTVVMGSAVGLRLEQVTPLLRSLRACGYSGDIVLFVGRRLHCGLRREPIAAGVRLVRGRSLLPEVSFRRVHRSRALWTLWRLVQGTSWSMMKLTSRLPLPPGVGTRLQEGIARMTCTPMEARFLHFRRFLEHHPYERVLFTDVRDVLFQRDPFDELPPEGLAVSIETRRYTVGSEPHNRMWVRDTFGSDVLARISASPVSCVGVTYGGGSAALTYLRLMTKEILRLSAAAARRGGADTAIHNVLIWTNQLGEVEQLETLASPVATLNEISDDEVQLSARGTLLNTDGSEVSVVHQYDRVAALASTLPETLM